MTRCSHQFDQFHRCCNGVIGKGHGEDSEFCTLHAMERNHNHLATIGEAPRENTHRSIAHLCNLIAELQTKVKDLEERVQYLSTGEEP